MAKRNNKIRKQEERNSSFSEGVYDSFKEIIPIKTSRNFDISDMFKNVAQRFAYSVYEQHDVVFLLGPAGTGKSHLACMFAVNDLLRGSKDRIVLTRPIVEAGESLGYLPGTFSEKTDPYMMPLYDCIRKMAPSSSSFSNGGIAEEIQKNTEVAPLAYMRGRAEPLDNLIPTPSGYKRMGDLKVGDYVFGSSGKPVLVLGVYPQGKKHVYNMEFSDNSSVLCSEDHLWNTRTTFEKGFHRGFSTRTAYEIASTIHKNHEIPVISAPVEIPYFDTSINPYQFGLTLINEKSSFIPEELLWNSVEVRKSLLQGILDSSSCVFLDEFDMPQIQFYNWSEEVSEQVVWLVQSLGGVAILRKSDHFVVDVFLPKSIEPFRCEEKILMYTKTSDVERFITEVQYVGEMECQCISVHAEDHLYLTEGFLVTHNTFDNSVCILDEAQNCTKEQLLLFLTRLGESSKMIVTGDPCQSDIGKDSALMDVFYRLEGMDGFGMVKFSEEHIVRHKIVAEIIRRLKN